MFTPSLLILLASAGLIDGRSVLDLDTRHIHNLVHKRASQDLLEARQLLGLAHKRQDDGATATTLVASAIQTGSFFNGSQEIGANEANQALSLTSHNNFINNCAGKTLTNGLQITTGSCNGIPMGDIPAKTNMVSSIITFPLAGSATIESDTTFNITVQMSNLVAGSFTNADATYYAAPQQLSGGIVVGHTHVTVQDLGATLNPTTALDATQFAFFKGINDAGNGQGLLSATVTGGLPAGNYRVCTLASASNHQPVLMPVAQRGTSDDCTKFTVIGSGTTINVAANDGTNGEAAAALAASAVAAGPGFVDTATSSSNTSTTTSSTDSTSTSSSSTTTDSGKGKDTGTTTTSSSDSSTTTDSGKGKGKDSGTTTTSSSDSLTTTDSGKDKDVGTTTTSSSVSSLTTSTSDVGTTTTSSSKGKKTSVAQKVVVIESFFEFALGLGGLPPAVGKSGNQFKVLEELFDEVADAASAACGTQFTACISLAGAGFSLEECTTQKDSCGSAASTATSATSAAQVTGTAIVAVSASVTGSIISQTTVSTTIPVATSSGTPVASSSALAVAAVQTTAASIVGRSSESTCVPLVTSTVYVDEASTTDAADIVSSTTSASVDASVTNDDAAVQTTASAILGEATESTCAPLVTSTITVNEAAATGAVADVVSCTTPPASTVTVQPSTTDVVAASGTASAASTVVTADASALGGIAAPPVLASGDPTRPFLVNGNTFVNEAAAVQRSCDIQFNACADAVNGGTAVSFTIADCQTQEDDCINDASS